MSDPGTFPRSASVRDPRREPSGEKPAPKAVVGRMSLYLRQLEAFQAAGGLDGLQQPARRRPRDQ